jgi:hypothetical protein
MQKAAHWSALPQDHRHVSGLGTLALRLIESFSPGQFSTPVFDTEGQNRSITSEAEPAFK